MFCNLALLYSVLFPLNLNSNTFPGCSLCMDLEKGGGTTKHASEKLKQFTNNDKAGASDVKGMAATCVRSV